MKFYSIALAAAAAFFLGASTTTDAQTPSHTGGAWPSASVARANGGFLGSWCQRWSTRPATITDSPTLKLTDWMGSSSNAHYSGSHQIVAERWAQTGTLSAAADKITWTDGNVWVRTTSSRC